MITNYIKIDDLVHGGLYKIKARNFSIGIFDSTDNTFTGIRRKFIDEFLDKEIHWDYNDIYGTVKPLEYIEDSGIKKLRGITDIEYNLIFNYLRMKVNENT